MMIRTFSALAAGMAMNALLFTAASAESTQVGRLSCDVSSGVGMFLVQKQTMHCMFLPANGAPPESYFGRIDEFGVALGAVSQGHLIWGVLAPSVGIPHGALSGTYVGVGAEASAGAGVGANLLVGGTGRSFSLQPLSIEGQTGLNIAGGITTVTLMAPPPQ
jgi:Protein of unknown function (DUF992)